MVPNPQDRRSVVRKCKIFIQDCRMLIDESTEHEFGKDFACNR